MLVYDRRVIRAAFSVLVLLSAPTLLGQDYTERVEVELVEVPVNVLDRQGNAISGLSVDDFILRVNGEEMRIDYFDVLVRGEPTGRAETGPDTESPRIERRILLLIDTVFNGHRALYRGIDGAASFLEAADPDDLIAIAAYRSGRVEYLTPFTRDRALAYRAVRTLSAPAGNDPLRLTITPGLRAALEPRFGDAVDSGSGLQSGTEDPEAVFGTSGDWLGFDPLPTDDIGSFGPTGNVMEVGTGRILSEMADDQNRRHIREQIETLQGIAQDLATLSGQKQLLFVSQGFASSLVMRDNRLSRTLRAMQTEFRQQGVLIHTISTDTLGLGKGLTTNRSQALFNLAHETGGIAYANSNRIDRHFDRFARAQRVTYLLSFRLPEDPRPGFNRIQVEVVDPRSRRVIARPGFYGVTRKVEPTESAINLKLAEAVLGEAPPSDIRLELKTSARGPTGTVQIITHPVDLLAVGSESEPIIADLLVYVLKDGAVHRMKSRKVAIDLGSVRLSLLANGQAFETAKIGTKESFALEPGGYEVRVVYRFAGSPLTGVGSASLEIPE